MREPTVQNLLDVYSRASKRQIAEGLSWYADANVILKGYSVAFGVPFDRVAAVCAMLSPQTEWNRNLRHVVEFLESGTVKGIPANRLAQVKRIDSGEPIESVCSGFKVNAFYRSILSAGTSNEVCIDSHAIHAALGCRIPEKARKAIFSSKRLYSAFTETYVEAAGIAGIPAQQFQAVVWVTIRGTL